MSYKDALGPVRTQYKDTPVSYKDTPVSYKVTLVSNKVTLVSYKDTVEPEDTCDSAKKGLGVMQAVLCGICGI